MPDLNCDLQELWAVRIVQQHDGKVIPKDCNVCHTLLSQSESGVPLMRQEKGVPFQHPVDIGDLTQVTCSDCHTGVGF
jgi:hypothetical protein